MENIMEALGLPKKIRVEYRETIKKTVGSVQSLFLISSHLEKHIQIFFTKTFFPHERLDLAGACYLKHFSCMSCSCPRCRTLQNIYHATSNIGVHTHTQSKQAEISAEK